MGSIIDCCINIFKITNYSGILVLFYDNLIYIWLQIIDINLILIKFTEITKFSDDSIKSRYFSDSIIERSLFHDMVVSCLLAWFWKGGIWIFVLLPDWWEEELDQRYEIFPSDFMTCIFEMQWTVTDLVLGSESL